MDTINNCTTCKFSQENKMTNDLQRSFSCLRYPPKSQAIPTQQGIAQMTQFPSVTKEMFCYEHRIKNPLLN